MIETAILDTFFRVHRFDIPDHQLANELRAKYAYCPQTGVFTHRCGRRAGQEAGAINHGYRRLNFRGRLHFAHRLAWIYVHGTIPAGIVDHINRVKHDNRIDNLRVVDRKTNAANADINPVHLIARGVCRIQNRKRPWVARIEIAGHRMTIGVFHTEEDARQAYLSVSRAVYGSSARCELAGDLPHERSV